MPESLKLPAGWTAEPFYARSTKVVALRKPPPDSGFVTVDFELRVFELGMCQPRPARGGKTYRGRGWQDQLVADAVEALEAVFR